VDSDPVYSLVLTLDVISGFVQSLKSSIDPLIAQTPLVGLLVGFCSDPIPDVRQSAFSLVGDLSQWCVVRLIPAFDALAQAALRGFDLVGLSELTLSAFNNACWALGELCIAVNPPELVEPYAQSIASQVMGIITYPGSMPNSLLENCAITLGRVASRAPSTTSLSAHLPQFLVPWCRELQRIRDGSEKQQAFEGLCALLVAAPGAVVAAGKGGLTAVAAAMGSWARPPQNVMARLSQAMRTISGSKEVAAHWPALVAELPVELVTKLKSIHVLG